VPVPEETFTHSHLSWLSTVSYQLHPSTTIHGILPVQSTHLTVFFHNLSPSFLWSTSWPGTFHFILHIFLHPIIVFFSQHMPMLSSVLYLIEMLKMSKLYLKNNDKRIASWRCRLPPHGCHEPQLGHRIDIGSHLAAHSPL